MAKGKGHPSIPSQPEALQKISVRSIIENIKGAQDAPRIYANHAQFSINQNEIYIDLYRFEPDPAHPQRVHASLLQRVIIPFGLAKGFVAGLANLIAGFEKVTGLKLPYQRDTDTADTLKIWEEQ